MGQYRKLLKIVPLKQDEHDENITIDFHRPERHALSELHPRLLNFQIATVEGALMEPFDENYKMYMSLQFNSAFVAMRSKAQSLFNVQQLNAFV